VEVRWVQSWSLPVQYIHFNMVLGQWMSTVRLCLTAAFTQRQFATQSIVQAGYKMKSHSGAKKRWRSLASGNKFKRVGYPFQSSLVVFSH
jgi:hypothetical protein